MDAQSVHALQRAALAFRAAIERSRADKASSALPYFPDGACRMVRWLFAIHLLQHDSYSVRFVTGHVPAFDTYVRHAWLLVDDVVVDLTADPFGEAPVIFGAPTPFHDSLDERQEVDAATAIAAFSADEASRYRRLLTPIESRLPGAARARPPPT